MTFKIISPTTSFLLSYWLFNFLLPISAFAMGLRMESAPAQCGAPLLTTPQTTSNMTSRLAGSHIAFGAKDIAIAWLSSPTQRYPHRALGSNTHAGSVTVQPSSGKTVVYQLPLHRVFEDLTPRLIDLDQDGKDELVLIESDALRGSAIVVLGLAVGSRETQLVELARSPSIGTPFRWLNIIGAADFNDDGKLDLAAVTTPHIGGTLTLYHYRPPHLTVYAKAMDVSNHQMGSPEQQLAVIVKQQTVRPTVLVPDMSLKALHALRWQANGQWTELSDVMPLQAKIERLTPIKGGACALLADKSWWRVLLTH